MPEVFSQLCGFLWRATAEGKPPKEWIAFLLTTNGRDISCYYEQGEEHQVECSVSYVSKGLGLVMTMHTHPNQSYPSLSDLGLITSNDSRFVHAPAEIVVSGPYTFLMLRDERVNPPSAWIFRSDDRKNFYPLSEDELRRVYGAR